MADRIRPDPNLPGYGGEPDDAPPGRTVPAEPVVGRRYMQQESCGFPGNWAVLDWRDGVDGHPEPYEVACSLLEADARLLAFGPQLLEVCKRVVRADEEYVRDDGSVYPDRVMGLLGSDFLDAVRLVTDGPGIGAALDDSGEGS